MSTGSTAQTSWLERVDQRRDETSYGLLGTGAVCAGLAVFFNYRSWESYYVLVLALYWAAAVCIAAGLWFRFHDRSQFSRSDATRGLLLLLAGLIGIDLFLSTFGAVYFWRETVFAGWEEWQGKDGWRIWVIALLAASGPALILLGLVGTRTEEHSQPLLRRLFYGFNAVLAGQLVLLILLLLNILGYVFLPRESDWTKSRLYTLTSKSQNLLRGLERPIKVYLILDSSEQGRDVFQLLNNCRRVTDKLDWELVLRGRQDTRVRELMRRYTLLDPIGLVVVAGTEPNEESQFIKFMDLYEFAPMNPRSRQDEPTFKGEDALMTAINSLEEGKSKPIVYFLQGHGELDISHSVEVARPTQKADQLRSHLEKANYEVKALRLSNVELAKPNSTDEVVAQRVPDDATAVIIAGPREQLERSTLDALRQYMIPKEAGKKKGKLIVLLDVVVDADKQMKRTGLESFLSEFNVDVGNERIMSPVEGNPASVIVVANPQPNNRNSLALGLSELELRMNDVRPVRPRSGGPQPGGGNFQAETLLMTANRAVWAETNLADPVEVLEGYIRSRKGPRLSLTLPVAVTVSEPTGGMMPGDPHAGIMGGDSTPRLVVIGDAGFASNAPDPVARRDQPNPMYYSLVSSSLAWLRDKPSNIGIEGKKRELYRMNETTNVTRMIGLPTLLILASIIGLGLGVWVVRRR